MLKRIKFFAAIACFVQSVSFLLLYIFSSKKKGSENYLVVGIAGIIAALSLYSSYNRDSLRAKRKTAMDEYILGNEEDESTDKESTILLDEKIDGEAFPDIDDIFDEAFAQDEEMQDDDMIDCENEISQE